MQCEAALVVISTVSTNKIKARSLLGQAQRHDLHLGSFATGVLVIEIGRADASISGRRVPWQLESSIQRAQAIPPLPEPAIEARSHFQVLDAG